jgi:opacity protein-like surface antigen
MAVVAKPGPDNAEGMMMTRLILASAVLALAIGMTAAAMASDRKSGQGAHYVGYYQHHIRHGSRFAGVRWSEGPYPAGGSPAYNGGFIDLGPLGMTAACGSYANRYRSDYCGPRSGAPIDAWSY